MLREDLQLVEFKNAEYLVSFLSPGAKEEEEEIVRQLEQIELGTEQEKFDTLMNRLDNLPKDKEIPLQFDVLDGTEHLATSQREIFNQAVRLKVHSLFRESADFRELEKLALFKDAHPDVRIKMVIAHGGAISEWDPVQPRVAKKTWMYLDRNNQSHPIKELIETMNKEADVLLLVCCNEDKMTIQKSPLTVFYSHGIVSVVGDQNLVIVPGTEGEYQESADES